MTNMNDDARIFKEINNLKFNHNDKIKLKGDYTNQIGIIVDIRFTGVGYIYYTVHFNNKVDREYLGLYLEKLEE